MRSVSVWEEEMCSIRKHSLFSMLGEMDIVIHEPVELKSHEKSEYYIDIKKAYGNSHVLSYMADCMWDIIDKETTCLACSGYGGLPLASVISSRYGPCLIMIRDKPKGHGRGGFIDGYVPGPADKVCIIDDVATSGSSLRHMASHITEAEILEAAVVINRGNPDLSDVRVPLKYLFSEREFL